MTGQKDLMGAVATKVACARVIQASPLDGLEPFRFRLNQKRSNCDPLQQGREFGRKAAPNDRATLLV
jgi:hypothetical protein